MPERRIVLTVDEERILLPATTSWEQACAVVAILDGALQLDRRQYGCFEKEKVRAALRPCSLLWLDSISIEVDGEAPEADPELEQPAPRAPSIPRREAGVAGTPGVAFPLGEPLPELPAALPSPGEF